MSIANWAPVEIPEELRQKVNNVQNRILFLSPSVLSGQERECRREDFESLANDNIGVGGFGKVYKVRHKISLDIYAIKVINKVKIIEQSLIEQIKLEVEIMYKLNHPYIVKLYNHYEDDESFYLILEYAPQGQLFTFLQQEGRFSERVAAQYLREVISACKYLHSLDPPIVHRDIKPENILLNQEGAVKLADFGWSNFFNGEQRRQTYCGTPEYLSPEMILKSGHDKSLDIWNLGVLLFELLTGKPPFEGASQQILFEHILSNKVNWPQRFNPLAKDLIKKLLKASPQDRLKLEEIEEHPWFRDNPAIKQVKSILSSQPSLVGSQIKPNDYKVISQPNSIEKMRSAGSLEKQSRKSLLEQKLDEINSYREQCNELLVAELTQKLTASRIEIQEFKYLLQQKQIEINSLRNGDNEQQDQKLFETTIMEKDTQIKKLQEEVWFQRSLNKNRDQLLSELDQKSKEHRSTEMQLKMTKNDLMIYEQQNKSLAEQVKTLKLKTEELKQKLAVQKENVFKLEKAKELLVIESEAKIEFLKEKFLTRLGVSTSNSIEQPSSHFNELLDMCRQDMQEILDKIQRQLVQEQAGNDKLRTELVAQGKRMNDSTLVYEMKLTQLRADLTQEFSSEIKATKQRNDSEIAFLESQLSQKMVKIRNLEKQEKRSMIEKEQILALQEQVSQLQTQIKNGSAEKNLLESEKRMLLDLLKFRETTILKLEAKLTEKSLH